MLFNNCHYGHAFQFFYTVPGLQQTCLSQCATYTVKTNEDILES